MKTKRIITIVLIALIAVIFFTGCGQPANASREGRQDAMYVAGNLAERQPMPTDIQASLERHNIIRRSYWINGMRERAMNLPSPIADPPLGHIVLFAPNGGVVGRFLVEGKVTSLNYSLVPYSEYWEIAGAQGRHFNRWIANAGGVYGTNTNGVFWFTPDGMYMEWNGTYLFSDVPFIIDDPILRIDGGTQ